MHFWGIFCFNLRVERGVTLGNCNLSIQPTFCEILSSWLSIASSLLHHLSQTVCASHSGGDALRLPGVMPADRTERVKRTQLAEAVRRRSLFTCTWTPLRMPKQLASPQSAERGWNPPETAAASHLRHQVWCSGETLLMWAQRDRERL